jgi:calcium-dependent protein kinase
VEDSVLDGTMLKPLAKLGLKRCTPGFNAVSRYGVDDDDKSPQRGVVERRHSHNGVPIRKRFTVIRKLTDHYNVLSMIHDGGEQCRVKRVQSRVDGKEYVMKIQRKELLRSRNEEVFRRMTAKMMNMPESDHLVRIFNCFEDSDYFYTLQEACDGGNLAQFRVDDFFLRLLTCGGLHESLEKEVQQVMREVLLSLDYLHKKGIIHKDVKLENLVFKNKGTLEQRDLNKRESIRELRDAVLGGTRPTQLKLIDFDFTEDFDSNICKAVLGTDGYIAPEVYLGKVFPKSDIFSAGVMMFTIIAGRFPYDDAIFDDGLNQNFVGCPKMKEIYDKLQRFKVRFGRSWKRMDEAKEFCRALLQFDVDKRPSAEEALQHPWMQKFAESWPTQKKQRGMKDPN